MLPRAALSLVAQACSLISPNWPLTVDSAALLNSVFSQLRVRSSPVLTLDNLDNPLPPSQTTHWPDSHVKTESRSSGSWPHCAVEQTDASIPQGA